MDIQKTLQWAVERLRTSDSPDLDAEVLLSFALKKPKEFLFMHPEQKLTSLQLTAYSKLIKRRAKGEPVAYLTGHKEFYGLDFAVDKNVLIPRPETELLVEEAKQRTRNKKQGTILIDVGTGSGCIPIALANYIRKSELSGYPDLNLYATDISKASLKLARLNAQRHGVKIKFLHGNLLEPFFKSIPYTLYPKPLIIIANLPYLTTRQWRQTSPDIRLYEPRQALDGGPDGLKYFRELFRQIKQLLTANSLRLTAFLEIDPAQTKKIKGLAKKYLPSASVQIKKDFAGRKRLAMIGF